MFHNFVKDECRLLGVERNGGQASDCLKLLCLRDRVVSVKLAKAIPPRDQI
jgi:hypothetical protein